MYDVTSVDRGALNRAFSGTDKKILIQTWKVWSIIMMVIAGDYSDDVII